MAKCACEVAGPCKDDCQCFDPRNNRGGCAMCATYGSKAEQRMRGFMLLQQKFMFHNDYDYSRFRRRHRENFGAKKRK